MKNVDAFVELCRRVISDNKAGLLDLHLAAEKIHKQSNAHPFEKYVHPMLVKVSDLTFDITEDYRSDKDDKYDWDIITKTIKNYIEGSWEPTCWILNAMYGEYSKHKLTHSYSVVVRRQNGQTIIDTASEALNAKFSQANKELNTKQTDERYLQNMAKFAPNKVGIYKLASVDVAEYLVEPYYSTGFQSDCTQLTIST